MYATTCIATMTASSSSSRAHGTSAAAYRSNTAANAAPSASWSDRGAGGDRAALVDEPDHHRNAFAFEPPVVAGAHQPDDVADGEQLRDRQRSLLGLVEAAEG